jgi:cation transporter-like permease
MKEVSVKKLDDEVSEFNSEVDSVDNYADDDDNDADADVESEVSPTLIKLSLEEENEVLKADLSSLKKEVTRLRQRENLSRIQARKQLPASLRQISNSRRRQRPTHLPERKSSGIALGDDVDDELGTVEPAEQDLEKHESGRGLFHRKQQYSPLQQAVILKPIPQKQGLFFPELPEDDSGREMDDFDQESATFLLPNSSGVTNDSVVDDDDVVLPESFWSMVKERAGWLVGLLILQSMSSFILANNERLLQEHVIIVRFLTMLVGAGGNAGNQASVRVIRGLAIGSVNHDNLKEFLTIELKMGLALSIILGIAGCIRAAVFFTPITETIAITTALFFIVFISIILGAVLPLMMNYVRIDPAHSSTTIQVIMDILGVSITVCKCMLWFISCSVCCLCIGSLLYC